MIEHEQLIKLAEDEDDYPVMLYSAKKGVSVDWKVNSPEEVLYIPESAFQSVYQNFIDKVGLDGYYTKTILDICHVELLCSNTGSHNYSDQQQYVMAAVKQFIDAGLNKKHSHYLAFEGP